jgi:transcriptional repressor NrdR
MKCPKCQNVDTKVLDSRVVQDGTAIRRRRECEYCSHRFTTFEKMGITDLVVIKKDGSRAMYDRSKITKAFLLAYAKRDIAMDKIEDMVSALELSRAWESEVTSKQIGLDILRSLQHEDPVAYIRFASVYMNFDYREDFEDLMKRG